MKRRFPVVLVDIAPALPLMFSPPFSRFFPLLFPAARLPENSPFPALLATIRARSPPLAASPAPRALLPGRTPIAWPRSALLMPSVCHPASAAALPCFVLAACSPFSLALPATTSPNPSARHRSPCTPAAAVFRPSTSQTHVSGLNSPFRVTSARGYRASSHRSAPRRARISKRRSATRGPRPFAQSPCCAPTSAP